MFSKVFKILSGGVAITVLSLYSWELKDFRGGGPEIFAW